MKSDMERQTGRDNGEITVLVIMKNGENYSAYSPDVPGCVATGKTKDENDETCGKP